MKAVNKEEMTWRSSFKSSPLTERIANMRMLRFSTIQVRLTLFFTVILLAVIGTTSTVNYTRSSDALTEKMELYSRQMIAQFGSNLDLELRQIQFVIDDIISGEDVQSGLAELRKDAREDGRYQQTNVIDRRIAHKLSLLPYIASVTIRVDERSTLGTYHSLGMDQLNAIIERTGESADFHYDMIEDTATGKAFISVSKGIRSAIDGASLGVIVITVEERRIAELYDDIHFGSDSEIFILDTAGTVVSSSSPGQFRVFEPFPEHELRSRLTERKGAGDGTFIGRLGDAESLVAYDSLRENDWTVAAAIPRDFIRQEANELRVATLAIGVVCLIAAAVVAYMISLGVSVPGRRLREGMKRLNDGDLSLTLGDRHNDEMGLIARGFDDMAGALRDMLAKVAVSAEGIETQSKIVAIVAGSLRHNQSRLANTMRGMAAGSAQQAADAAGGSERMNGLSPTIDGIGARIDRITESIIGIDRIRSESERAVGELNDRTADVHAALRTMRQDMESLDAELGQITGFARLISGISKQINIVALNASIEATRAGETGKGFVVLAGEIRQLARQTRVASEQIAGKAALVVDKSRATIRNAGSSANRMNGQLQAVEATTGSFAVIGTLLESMLSEASGISAASVSLRLSRDNTLLSIGNMASVAEATAAAAEEAHAFTKEQEQETATLAQMSKELEQASLQLSEAVIKFQIPDAAR
jgi:methyl-accepting chemotaxis protein